MLGVEMMSTRKEQAVEVRCNEGVVVRIGPEPDIGIREGNGEAYAGVVHASLESQK